MIGLVTSLLVGKTQAENSYTSVEFEDVLKPTGAAAIDPSLTFFMQKAELFGKMRFLEGICVSDEALEYAFTAISIDGETAIVDVIETYSFQINTISMRSTVNIGMYQWKPHTGPFYSCVSFSD